MATGEPRDLSRTAAATMLRAMMGLEPGHAGPGELAATLGRSLPTIGQPLDSDGWIAWCLAGLAIFGGRLPPSRVASREARRVVMVLAMLRAEGNITHAAKALGTSRRCLREGLKTDGLYPWPGTIDPHDGGTDAT